MGNSAVVRLQGQRRQWIINTIGQTVWRIIPLLMWKIRPMQEVEKKHLSCYTVTIQLSTLSRCPKYGKVSTSQSFDGSWDKLIHFDLQMPKDENWVYKTAHMASVYMYPGRVTKRNRFWKGVLFCNFQKSPKWLTSSLNRNDGDFDFTGQDPLVSP